MFSNYDDRLTQDSPTLQAAINGKLRFNPGEAFSESFALFSKDAGTFIGMTLVMLFMVFAIIFIPFLGLVGVTIVMPAMIGGFLLAFRDLDTLKTTTFSRLFDAFKNLTNTALIYFVTSILVGILPSIFLFAFLGSDFFEILQRSGSLESDPEELMDLSTRFGTKMILLYAILIPYYFVFGLAPMIAITIGVFNPKMDFGTLLKSAFLICLKNPGKIALTSLIISLIYFLGLLAICIGLLVALPVIIAFFYHMYKRSLQPDQENADRFLRADDTLDSGLV